MATTGFGYGSRPVYLDRAIYTTITLMSVLILYDGWQNLNFRAAVWVILAPVFAMFVSHVFSASLARQAELHRHPGGSETMRIIRTESRFLLLATPALALLIILTVARISLGRSIQAVIFLEGASLGFWGFVAGRRAGLAGWPLVRTVVFGLIVGLLVLALQVFLQPRNASLLV
jgi:archaellum biogenesis protein FlaJ (TadC family)